MKSVLNVEVSCFKSYAGKQPKSINLLNWLKSDKYKDTIKNLRKENEKSTRDKIKAKLPAITVSGTFYPTRKEENLIKHSGLICIDIDLKGNEDISNFGTLKEQLFHIENVAYAGLSASGNGFFLILPIEYPEFHKEHFNAIKEDLSGFGLTIDAAPQNVASLRGYSWDEKPLFRHQPVPYSKWKETKTIEKKKKSKLILTKEWEDGDTKAKVEYFVHQIVAQQIDITQNEPDWFRIACALANEFGEWGRDYFHQISQFHVGYDLKDANTKFDHALSGKYSKIGIGTFIQLAKRCGSTF